VTEPIRFYLDEHVAKAVAGGLRRRGVDVLTALEAGLLSEPDEAHLNRAVQEQRVLFTQDEDFLRFHAVGRSHAGIVFAAQHTPVGAIVRGLMLIYSVLSPQEMTDHVEFI
jgi:hypothetical protein